MPNKMYSIYRTNNVREIPRIIIRFLGIKLRIPDLRTGLLKLTETTNKNFIQIVYNQILQMDDEDLFAIEIKNEYILFIISKKSNVLDLNFIVDYISSNGYNTKLFEFKKLDPDCDLYKEHIERTKNGEFLWKYAERYNAIEHKFLYIKDDKIFIKEKDCCGEVTEREFIDGITVGEYIQNKSYNEKLDVLEKMFKYIFKNFQSEQDSTKVASILSDCHMRNVMITIDGHFRCIDYDTRYKEDLDKEFCIYNALYNYDKKMYYDILKRFNFSDKHNLYKAKYSVKNVAKNNMENTNQQEYERLLKKYFSEEGFKPHKQKSITLVDE